MQQLETKPKTRTVATSKDRDSEVRQRCGCKIVSCCAESSSAPSSCRHVQDVHNIDGITERVLRCTRRETHTLTQHITLLQQHITLLQLMHPPHKATPHATTQTKPTTRTRATSEDRDSEVRQRCGCKMTSSCAESSSAPSSCCYVQDVHNIGHGTASCTRRETQTLTNQITLLQLMHPPHKANASCNNSNKTNNTYPSHQRRSRLRGSAAM